MTALQGRRALVTGGGRGLGRRIALALAAEGAHVTLVARTRNELEETAEMVRTTGGEARVYTADVAQLDEVGAVSAAAVADGGVDILVNNAGSQRPIGPLVENDAEAWMETIRVNLFGTFAFCRAVLPHMIHRRAGRIVNVSGGGATQARSNFSAYAASKTGVARLTETLALEAAEFGVSVNAIAPGPMNTRMLDEIIAAGHAAGSEYETARAQLVSGGTPIELPAALVVFLATTQTGLTGKLIAAPHDDWQEWESRMEDMSGSDIYTIRRLDQFTIRPLLGELS